MAGGTGGHVYPALAVARALEAHSQEIVWLGTHRFSWRGRCCKRSASFSGVARLPYSVWVASYQDLAVWPPGLPDGRS
jgi:hypothetical protein